MVILSIYIWDVKNTLFIFLFMQQVTFAQLSKYDWSSVKQLTTADGLPSNFTDVLMQDSRGFMWFVTNNGIVRYDGIAMKNYLPDINDSNSFSPDWFYDMIQDKEGNIWIAGNNNGIYLLNPVTDKLVHYYYLPDHANSIANAQVTGFETDAKGKIWISTFGGLTFYDRGTKKFKSYYHRDNDSSTISHNQIWNSCTDAHGNLWLATSAGFDCFNVSTGKVIKHITDTSIINFKIKQDRPILVFKGREKTIWLVCANTGAFKYDIDKNKILMHFSADKKNPLQVHSNLIQHVFEDMFGNIWISSGDEIDVFEKSTGKIINVDQLDPIIKKSNAYSSMIQDKQGKLWIASGLNGIISIDPVQKKFHQIPERNQSIPASAMLTLLDIGNNRFLTTTENGAFIYDVNQKKLSQFFLPYHGRELTTEGFIACSYIDNTGLLFLGTAIKTITYDTASKEINMYVHDINDSTSLSELSCTGVLRDKKGRYWCAAYGGGLNRFYRETGKFKSYKVHEGKNSISTNSVHNTFIDSKGNIYVGSTGGGFIQFDPDSEIFTVYKHVAGNLETPSNDNVEYFYESKQGYIFFTTQGGGLNVFNPKTKKFRSWTTKDGFATNIISGIIDDNHGNLWLGTYSGISSFSMQNDPFATECKFQIRNYNVSDGLPCNEFMFGGVYKDKEGNLYFGTACGKIAYFNPDELKDNSFIAPIYITGFSLFNKEIISSDTNKFLKTTIEYAKKITITYRENVISFSFASLNLIHPENNHYAYILEGFNNDWIYADASKRFANYTNLDPGEYIFKVKGSNNDGVWNENPATIKLIITPPYWKTWWFRVAIILAVAVAVYILYRFRINQLLKLQGIRNRIAHDLHDNIGSTLNSISIYSEVAQNKSRDKIPELDLIGESSRKVIDAMSDIVWTINPENDSFEKIIFRMRSHTHQMMKVKNIEYIFKADEKLNELTLPMQVRKNFYLIFKEALNNLIKYSKATQAGIMINYSDNIIEMFIRDNGVGFDTGNPSRGNGLSSMKQRANEMQAKFKIESVIGQGTSVELNLRIK